MKQIILISLLFFFVYSFDFQCPENCKSCEFDELNRIQVCFECKEDYFLVIGEQTCLKECPVNYYLKNQSTCEKCHYSCKQCSGSGQYQCLTCENSRFFLRTQQPEEGYCYCQNEIYSSICKISSNELISSSLLRYYYAAVILALFLSLVERNASYFVLIIVFFQDLSLISLINVIFPLQLQDILSCLHSFFAHHTLIPSQIFYDYIIKLDNKLIFNGNFKVLWLNNRSSLFALNVLTYLIILKFLKLAYSKFFRKRISRCIRLTNENNAIKLIQLLLGNEVCLLLLFEIVNIQLQLRSSVAIEIFNKLVLLISFCIVIILTRKFLLFDDDAPRSIRTNLKNSQIDSLGYKKFYNSLILTQIVHSIAINLLFFEYKIQIFVFLLIHFCQLGYNIQIISKQNFIKPFYICLQITKIIIISMIAYLISISNSSKNHLSLRYSELVQIFLQILLKLSLLIFSLVLLYSIIKKLNDKQKKILEENITQEDEQNHFQKYQANLDDPPITNKFSSRISVKDRFLSNSFNVQSIQQAISTINISSHRSSIKKKQSLDSVFEKSLKQLSQMSINQHNYKNSSIIPINDATLQENNNL